MPPEPAEAAREAAPGYPPQPPAADYRPHHARAGDTPQDAGPGWTERPRRRWWHGKAWLLLTIPAGVTTWTAFMYIGIRAHRPQWLAWSAFYFGLLAAFMAVDAPTHPSSSAQAIATGCILAAWIGGGVHAAAISGSAVRRIDEYSDPAFKAGRPPLEAAKARIKRRAKGRKLLARQPQLAREVGLGRPDLPGTEDYGLVDVNHASQAALRMLPGVTEDAAQKIVSMRTELGGFSSAEDLGAALDLPPAMVDEMREVAVFL